jgi:hypothetical protein
MSFYFVRMQAADLESEQFTERLSLLLFPYYDERDSVGAADTDGQARAQCVVETADLLECVHTNHELLSGLKTFASWSNFIVAGDVTEHRVAEYWTLQRDFQHVWFLAYLADQFLERSLTRLERGVPESQLDAIDKSITEMTFCIARYTGVASSTLHERFFRLHHALCTSSRLSSLIASVTEKAGILRERYRWLLAERRSRADKKIELGLFLIAAISILQAWQAISELRWNVLFVVIPAALLGVYLFFPHFARRKDR